MTENQTLTRETVDHVANLARLNLTDAERDRFTEELINIIGFIRQLDAMDVSEIDAALDTTLETDFREDQPNRRFNRDELLKNAPEPEEGFYRVPQILDDETE